MNFPLKVIANSHLYFSCFVAAILAHSPFRIMVVQPPRNRIAVILIIVFAAWTSERACGKLAASQYLKFGHSLMQDGHKKAQQGNASAATRQTSASFRYFENAARLRPDHKDAILTHFYSGKAHQTRNEPEKAIEDFTRSLQVFKHFPEAFQARGLARLNQAMRTQDPGAKATVLDLAVADFDRALYLNLKEPLANFYLGTVKRIQGKPAESVAPFLATIKYSKNAIPDANQSLALAYVELDRMADARRTLEELLARFPNHPGARELLAQIKAGKRPKTR